MFANRYFAIAGGEWCYLQSLENTTRRSPPCSTRNLAYVYDLQTAVWSPLPEMPFHTLRTQGCCGKDQLFVISGMGGGVQSAMLTMHGTAAQHYTPTPAGHESQTAEADEE